MTLLKNECNANVDRINNINPKIYIFDLDGTIIDSSHRANYDINGNIDLADWIARSDWNHIQQDKLLGLAKGLDIVYRLGHRVEICTARGFDKENDNDPNVRFLREHNIYYDNLICRPPNVETIDHELKKLQCQHLFNFKWAKPYEKIFFDDNPHNLRALAELGATVYDARDVKGYTKELNRVA